MPSPFRGGDPFPSRRRPKQHDHAGQMTWAVSSDGVCRHCWCVGCGQEWELGWRDGKPSGWIPVLD